MNIADALDRYNLFFPDREAVRFDGERISYRRFWEDACGAARGLAGLGVTRGDRVGLFLSNRPEFLAAYYGCQKIGAICVCLSALSKADEIAYMVSDSGVRVLLAEAELAPRVPPRSAIPSVERIVTLDGAEGGDLAWEELLAGPREPFPTLRSDPRDGATMIYTSGTTGRPKGVLLTQGNLVSNTQAARYICDMRGDDRSICFLPLYHSFAQNFIANAVVQSGGTLVLHRKFEMEEALASAERDAVTRWYAVPPIYIKLLEEPRAARALAAVRYCFSAAAPLPAETARRWKERFGVPIHEGYGLTETTPFACYNHEFRHKAGSVGTPIMNVEIRITDPSGEDVPAGALGEIRVRGPNVMREYWNRPEETAEALAGGWLRTGDVGRFDDEGYLYVVDRLKDMINSSGLKIWPREVEEVLYAHPAVRECAVIGVPHPLYGETVKAVVAAAPGTDPEALRAWVRERLADYKVPRIVEFMDELPKEGPAGKIVKRALRKE